jgi:hypothetical protein
VLQDDVDAGCRDHPEHVGIGEPARDVVDDARPGLDAACAVLAFIVSMTRAPSAASAATTGSTRCSSAGATRSAPGRVDSPPTSRMSAPSRAATGRARSRRRREVAPAVAERVGRDVDDAHDRGHAGVPVTSIMISARADGSASSPRAAIVTVAASGWRPRAS